MKSYVIDVVYTGTITEQTVVRANNKEEAKEKILHGDVDDVVDIFTETEDATDFVFIQEDEVDDDE